MTLKVVVYVDDACCLEVLLDCRSSGHCASDLLTGTSDIIQLPSHLYMRVSGQGMVSRPTKYLLWQSHSARLILCMSKNDFLDPLDVYCVLNCTCLPLCGIIIPCK